MKFKKLISYLLAAAVSVNCMLVPTAAAPAEETNRHVQVAQDKVIWGNLDGNGDLRIQLYNVYSDLSTTDGKYDPDLSAVDPSLFKRVTQASITFTLDGLNEAMGGTPYYYAKVIYASEDWLATDETSSVAMFGDGTYTVTTDFAPAEGNGLSVLVIDIPGLADDLYIPEYSKDNGILQITDVKVELKTIVDKVQDGMAFDTLENGTMSLTSYNGEGGDVEIPPTVDGKTVTEIGKYAFADCENVSSVSIPAGVVNIGTHAFDGCSGLEAFSVAAENTKYYSEDGVLFSNDRTILWQYPRSKADKIYTVPAKVTQIAAGAFGQCSNIETVNFPSGLQIIGSGAFFGCERLTSPQLPDSVEKIESWAFGDCPSITSFTVPELVTEINGIVGHCTNLDTFIIKGKVTEITDWSFVDAKKLKTVVLPETVSKIGDGAFCGCKALTDINLPAGLTEIPESCFNGCSSLVSIDIPDEVTSIGNWAFLECSSLDGIILPPALEEIGDGAFKGCISITELVIPSSVSQMGTYVFTNCDGLETVTMPEFMDSIPEGCFNECTSLQTVNCGELESICGSAFSGCTSLESFDALKTVKYIGGSAFHNCSMLSRADLSSVVEIGDWSFFNTGITELILPVSGLKAIGEGSFSDCKYLQSVTLPEGLETIGSMAFNKCDQLLEAYIPASVTEIGLWAFTSSLLTIIGISNTEAEWYADTYGFEFRELLRDNVEGDWAYYILNDGTVALTAYYGSDTDVVIPEMLAGRKVTQLIGTFTPGVVGEDTNVQTVHLHSGITSVTNADMGSYYYQAFAGAPSLTAITVDDDSEYFTSVGGVLLSKDMKTLYAYPVGKAQTSYSVPAGVEVISNEAFTYADNLQKVVLPDSVTEIMGGAFANSAISSIDLGKGLVEIGNNAFGNCADLCAVKLPETLERIGGDAFSNTGLTTVDIPANVVEIGFSAFAHCPLTAVNVDQRNKTYCSVDGVLFDKDKTILYLYPCEKAGASCKVPDGVITLNAYSFADNKNLVSVDLPESLKYIGDSAFSFSTWSWTEESLLSTVNFAGKLDSIGSLAFSGTAIKELKADVQNIGYEAFINCGSLVSVELGDSLNSVGWSAFYNCTSLETVKIGDGLTTITEWTFENCRALETVEIGSGLQYIMPGAFSGCESLQSVTLPEGVKEMGVERYSETEYTNVFEDCPDTLTLYGYNNSYVETYAKKWNINFKPTAFTAVDAATGVEISVGKAILPTDVKLSVTKTDETQSSVSFNITLTKNGKAVQPDGDVEVRLPVPSGWSGEEVYVYSKGEGDSLTDMKAVVSDNYAVFKTTNIGGYVLTTEKQTTVQLGDVDGNGKINSVDARWVLQAISGKRTLTAEQQAAADVNNDGKINTTDAKWILQDVSGKRELD